MKIKVMSKETCLAIAKAKNPEKFWSEDRYLYYLPDEFFGKEFNVEVDSFCCEGFKETDTPMYWYIPCWFVENIWKEE